MNAAAVATRLLEIAARLRGAAQHCEPHARVLIEREAEALEQLAKPLL